MKGRVLAGVLLLAAFGTACGGAAQGGSSNETAADALNRGLEADGSYAAAHFNLGLLLRQLGQTAEAQTELAKAQQLDAKLVAPSAPASPARQATSTPHP